jgi:ABC-type transport system involved in multi-copper enzyme maturation permease subunit
MIGPVFTREAIAAPRRTRWYFTRALYVAVLLVLICTAWLVLAGTQVVRNIGDMARFGTLLFQILAPLQLALAMFSAALLTASAVAQEKDRGTFDLLLLTSLSNSELVLGKLLASLLGMLMLLAAAVPLFMLTALFGGVSFEQIARVCAITLGAILVAGSLGSTIALWREKTFQTLAMTVLVLVFWIGAWELVAAGMLGTSWGGVPVETWAIAFSPWRAVLTAALGTINAPNMTGGLMAPGNLSLLVSLVLAVLINAIAIARVRVWNPVRDVKPQQQDETIAAATAAGVSVHAAPGSLRPVWDNPVLWREVRTWAYGKRVLVIRAAYWLLFLCAVVTLHSMLQRPPADRVAPAFILAPFFVLSLVLINAQAVTSLTTERDGKALDLLLVTDLTPKEVVFGKLGGVFYCAKEMIVLPIALCGYLAFQGAVSVENLVYLVGGLIVMDIFSAVLGLHAGMIYSNSRSAIGVSLGTVFFLFIGIATCMRIMVAFSGQFQAQLAPFLAFMAGGGLALFFALGARNPSPAVFLASFVCPVATFWAITSYLLNQTLGVFLVATVTYAFATAALLIPAVFEFDVATGRTTGGE